MDATVILITSILIQFIAAFLALRLAWKIKKTPAWAIIALAVFLMALRRCMTFSQLLFGELPTPLDQTAELVGLLISILMLVGVVWIGHLFPFH